MKIKILLTLMTTVLCCGTALAQDSHVIKAESKRVTSTYAQTQYPIVFAHGMVGFNRIGTDILGMDYWYQILPDLARNGSNAWAARMSPFNSSEVRGEQYLAQLQEVMAITGAKKVNLIGHSHGAHAVRYAAGVMPDQVASVLTVGGANQGTVVASDVMKFADQTGSSDLLNVLISSFGKVIRWAQGLDGNALPHNALAAGHSTSIEGTAEFNQRFQLGLSLTPCGEGKYQDQGIALYSMTGNTQVTNPLDVGDAAMKVLDLISAHKGGANDGIVSVCSAKFGKTIRDDFPWNHLDEVNLLFGLKGTFAPDPVAVYRQHANRLKLQGL
ncbi:esterase/lipase family protein [Acinetobacter indicus]|uniref:esterase/lipase family protein n=1 Tax=Acinetobacter indicus TaxID=756892 RepID=UPI0025814A16|nr:triacylglycerol lipase [Acinetobacter indicus]